MSAAIAMAADPKIRVMLVRDGSLLDQRSMGILAEMIAENDYQLWIELLEDGGKTGIILEDGAIAGAAAPEPGKLL